jgi:hypothetical protein
VFSLACLGSSFFQYLWVRDAVFVPTCPSAVIASEFYTIDVDRNAKALQLLIGLLPLM